MPTKDIHNNLHFVPLFEPKAAVTDNTAQVSAVIDTAGYESAELVLITGTLSDADATFTTLVEDSDASGSGFAAVADDFLLGLETTASFTFSDDVECRKIGYRGIKRYLRVTVTPANNTGNLFLSGVAVLGSAGTRPTANPPQ